MCRQIVFSLSTQNLLVLKISFHIKLYDIMNCSFSQFKATREVAFTVLGLNRQ